MWQREAMVDSQRESVVVHPKLRGLEQEQPLPRQAANSQRTQAMIGSASHTEALERKVANILIESKDFTWQIQARKVIAAVRASDAADMLAANLQAIREELDNPLEFQ
jgi:hypothetical protein